MIPENISTFGGEVDWLFTLLLIVTSVTMVVVLSLILIFLIKYRYREGGAAAPTRGNAAL